MENAIHIILALGRGLIPEQAAVTKLVALERHVMGVPRLDARGIVTQAEEAAQNNGWAFDSTGGATLGVAGTTYRAGRFSTPTVGDLRTRARLLAAPAVKGTLRFWVMEGAGALNDIGSLQGTSDASTLFQAASQFNCLESPGPYVTPVAKYLTDPTQGPRASISAFPGTLLRHYAATGPHGDHFVQRSDGPQVELLADACGSAGCSNGYFTGHGANTAALVDQLEANFDAIRVGMHDNVQVVFGHNWNGAVENSDQRTIAQVFTSTAAGGWYGADTQLGKQGFRRACTQLLRAAYLGTLLAAMCLGKRRVVLTLIGGGVFGNPHDVILDAIGWALGEVAPLLPHDLDVVLNGYNLGAQLNLPQHVLPMVRKWQGQIVSIGSQGHITVLK